VNGDTVGERLQSSSFMSLEVTLYKVLKWFMVLPMTSGFLENVNRQLKIGFQWYYFQLEHHCFNMGIQVWILHQKWWNPCNETNHAMLNVQMMCSCSERCSLTTECGISHMIRHMIFPSSQLVTLQQLGTAAPMALIFVCHHLQTWGSNIRNEWSYSRFWVV